MCRIHRLMPATRVRTLSSAIDRPSQNLTLQILKQRDDFGRRRKADRPQIAGDGGASAGDDLEITSGQKCAYAGFSFDANSAGQHFFDDVDSDIGNVVLRAFCQNLDSFGQDVKNEIRPKGLSALDLNQIIAAKYRTDQAAANSNLYFHIFPQWTKGQLRCFALSEKLVQCLKCDLGGHGNKTIWSAGPGGQSTRRVKIL